MPKGKLRTKQCANHLSRYNNFALPPTFGAKKFYFLHTSSSASSVHLITKIWTKFFIIHPFRLRPEIIKVEVVTIDVSSIGIKFENFMQATHILNRFLDRKKFPAIWLF